MKIYIPEPPRSTKSEELVPWLTELAMKLNVAFEQIGAENLSKELRDRLEIDK